MEHTHPPKSNGCSQRTSSKSLSCKTFISSQLGFVGSPDGCGYQFLDRNSWPISNEQEAVLTVIDVVVGGAVRVYPYAGSETLVVEPAGTPDMVEHSVEEPRQKRMK